MSPNKKAAFAVLGFVLLALGLLSLVFGAIGIRFMFLGWMDAFNPLVTLLLHLAMLFGGILIMYLSLTDWHEGQLEENSESDGN
jgi:hypothetical protein